MITLKPCPFCDNTPSFTSVEIMDERRYVEMKLICCIEMSETLGFSKYKDMLEPDIADYLKLQLIDRWNIRKN